MSEGKPLDLDIKLKPVLKYKWGNEEGFRNFKKGYEKGFNEAQEILIKEIKQRIKKACEFYLKYRNNPNLLYDDFSINMEYDEPINKLREEINREYHYLTDIDIVKIYIEKYNEWLLKEAFKPVFEEVKENVKEND